MWPGRARSLGCVAGSIAASTVAARSAAEMPVVVLIPHDGVFQKTLSNLKEVESRGGRIIVVTDAPAPELESIAHDVLTVPPTNELLMPVVMTVPLQLLAYHVAVYRGTDVDQPRNLAKSVTVE